MNIIILSSYNGDPDSGDNVVQYSLRTAEMNEDYAELPGTFHVCLGLGDGQSPFIVSAEIDKDTLYTGSVSGSGDSVFFKINQASSGAEQWEMTLNNSFYQVFDLSVNPLLLVPGSGGVTMSFLVD